MRRRRGLTGIPLAGLLGLGILLVPAAGRAHPMGNFSISHYTGIRILAGGIELRYLIDLAEIPTFQEIQESGIMPEAGHPSLSPYLARKAEGLRTALVVELNGRRLPLESSGREVLFTPGVGGLPTMKLGIFYRAVLEGALAPGVNRLVYRDENFPDRAGWKEVVAVAGPGIVLAESSVPQRDRSRELTDYPTDLLNSPPQVLEAWLAFAPEPSPAVSAGLGSTAPPIALGMKGETSTPAGPAGPMGRGANPALPPSVATPARAKPSAPASEARFERLEAGEPFALQPNRQATRRDPFTDLIAAPEMSTSILLVAALVATTLGAFHALEPGHGKTVVAAYLVGSRGTARHALLLGLIVTASHTAGVYLLGGVTLYASRYVMPERLYPWLGTLSGLIIAGLGLVLFLKRYAGEADHHHPHGHAHAGEHTHDHAPGHDHGTVDHEPQGADHAHRHERHGHHQHHLPPAGGTVSLRELLALGVGGGIVPCPAALVVLLSAVALRRVGFGLFLIVAFSVGLAAVLIAIGLLMVYAGRLTARFRGDGRLITRWLPLTSSAVITVLGIAIAAQALMAGGILQLRLG